MNAIELTNVTKVYRRYARKKQFATLKSALLKGSLIQDLQPEEKFPALQGVSFACRREDYGIIGRNGSGKSTALKLVAGITKPTSGTVKVAGRVSALIELGAGFHPEISGRENVFINGIMLGLSKREIGQTVRRNRRVRGGEGFHRRAGQDIFVRHVHAPGDSPWPFTSIWTCCWWMKCWRWATRGSPISASTSSASSNVAAKPFYW